MLLMGMDHSKMPATFSCISECSAVNDFIFLGGYTCAEPARYEPLGITCIVDATNVPKLTRPRGVEYMKVSVDDSEHAALEPHFDAVADKILAMKQKGGKVLVHCAAGISRSTALVLAYLMKHEGMTLRNAYFFVKEKRPIVSPNPGFWRQLIKYECRLKGPGSESSVVMMKRGLRMREVPDVYVTLPTSSVGSGATSMAGGSGNSGSYAG